MESGAYDIYVSPDGSDFNSGLSMDNPLRTIQMASFKVSGDTLPPHVIHLAAGTYSPSLTGESYPLKMNHNTVLSGAGPELTVLDGEGIYKISHLAGKQNLIFENLRLTGGYSTGSNLQMYGGAIGCDSTFNLILRNITIDSCTGYFGGAIGIINSDVHLDQVMIRDNWGLSKGGALFARGKNTIELHHVTITGNKSSSGGGICGAGSYYDHSSLTVTGDDVKIERNHTTGTRGGAIYLYFTDFMMENFNITDHNSTYGGGIYSHYSNGTIYNFLFTNDTALQQGGAIAGVASNIDLVNCTFSGNYCENTGSLYFKNNSDVSIKNCISWNNGPVEAEFSDSHLTIEYSDIELGQEGIFITPPENLHWLEGNIDANPMFEMSGGHPWQLAAGSPCIDAGNPDTTGMNLPMYDLMGNYRLWDGDMDGDTIVDMGAYEFASVGVGTEEFQVQGSRFKIGCYPNPTQGIADFRFLISDFGRIKIKIYDIHGRVVAEVLDARMPAGEHVVRYDASGLPAGLYIVKVQAGSEMEVVKMVKR
jgi:hypothetical protein